MYNFFSKAIKATLRSYKSPFYIFEKKLFVYLFFLFFLDQSFEFMLCLYLENIAEGLTLLEGSVYLLFSTFILCFYIRIRHRRQPKSRTLQKNYLFSLNILNNFDINRIKTSFEDNFFYIFYTLISDLKFVYNSIKVKLFSFFIRYTSNSYSKINKKSNHYSNIIKKYM